MKTLPSKLRANYHLFFAIALILTIAAGWILTGFLERVAEKGFKERVYREANLIHASLSDDMDDVSDAASALSKAEPVVAVLSSSSPADLEHANRLLDRYKNSLHLSACYLLDRNGLDVASTDRNEKTGVIGKYFASSPYFKGASAGRPTLYLGLGKITRERGIYAAAPVADNSGKITGVAVIKRNVASIEESFREFPHAFLVSPEGIIFITSMEKLLYRSLWPVDERSRSELSASGQFGNITFEPLLKEEPSSGTYVSFDNNRHYIQRLPFGNDGWTLVFMEEPRIVANYRWFGILITSIFGLMVLFFYVVLRNKEKSLEAAGNLLKAKEDWKRTFDSVPDLIAIIDKNYRILSMNKAMAERFGQSRQEVLGRHCYEVMHDSQTAPHSCPHRKMLESGKTVSEAMFEMSLNGDYNVTTAPILAEDGTIESSVHVMHDISDLKRMEQSLKEYAQRLDFALEGSNDATWEWDLIADRGLLNKRYYEMTGYIPEEVETNYAFFIKTIHPDDVVEVNNKVTEHLVGKTGLYEAQYRMVTKTGKIRHVMGRGKIVMRDDDGRPIKMAGVVTDITEMKRLGEEVSRLHNLESIGLLAGGLSHDFNNMLNIIYGNITFARMNAKDDIAITEPLTDAEEACERARELGIRLQALSREISPVKEPMALAALVEDAAGSQFIGSNISHSVAAAFDILPIEADARLIRQVFENLFANAKEAMSAGGTVKICINNCVFGVNKEIPIGSGRYVCISIHDDGKGIPEENLTKIFNPYFSTKDTFNQTGMGLGLTICHAILKKHSGHISVDSKLGIGTKVTVYLPASADQTKLSASG